MNLSDRSAVVLDPHPLWLDALERVLDRLGVKVALKTTDVRDALAAIERHEPSLLVTEVETSDADFDGIACLRRAREKYPRLKAIVISSNAEPASIDAALGAGAAAYVLKTAHPEDFASAIRQAFHSSIYLPTSERAASRNGSKRTNERPADLTTREEEILKLVSAGLSNGEMARKLWVTEQTVKFHLSNIYRKLDVSNRTQASRWAQEHGMLDDHSEPAAEDE